MSLYWQLPMGEEVTLHESQSISRELTKKKEKKKRHTRSTHHEPVRNKKPKLHQRYSSSAPRDVRFSNQKKLRRMYRNC